MDQWLGQLLANAPLWVVIVVVSVIAVFGGFLYTAFYGWELKGPKSEWQKSWYKKKEKKHGKK